MTTATRQSIFADNDILVSRRFADSILHMLRDYIPDRLHREAWEVLAKTSADEKMELTSFAMRKEYEAWKSTQIDHLK